MRVSVSGRIFSEPAYVVVKTRIEPHAGNRGLLVALISDGFSTSSFEQLAGSRAPITRWKTFKDVPAGAYEVQAALERAPGALFYDRTSILVIGP